jgi:hypothetical protein
MPTSYSPVTTTSPSAPGSPCSMCTWRSRFPLGCSFGVAGSSARSGSVSASSTSYSTSIRAAAARAVSGWSAATMAIGSPW